MIIRIHRCDVCTQEAGQPKLDTVIFCCTKFSQIKRSMCTAQLYLILQINGKQSFFLPCTVKLSMCHLKRNRPSFQALFLDIYKWLKAPSQHHPEPKCWVKHNVGDAYSNNIHCGNSTYDKVRAYDRTEPDLNLIPYTLLIVGQQILPKYSCPGFVCTINRQVLTTLIVSIQSIQCSPHFCCNVRLGGILLHHLSQLKGPLISH